MAYTPPTRVNTPMYLLIPTVAKVNGVSKIGDVPYGAGYSMVAKEFDNKLLLSESIFSPWPINFSIIIKIFNCDNSLSASLFN